MDAQPARVKTWNDYFDYFFFFREMTFFDFIFSDSDAIYEA